MSIHRMGHYSTIVQDKNGDYIYIELPKGKTTKGFAKHHIEKVIETNNNIKNKILKSL